MKNFDEPVYLISVVARILNIHPQTLRQYEREGLIEPSRTEGKMRLYSQKDIDKIKIILSLTRDLGVNLAGVDIIFQLQDKIEEYEKEIENLKSEINKLYAKHKKSSSLAKKSSFSLIFYEEKNKIN